MLLFFKWACCDLALLLQPNWSNAKCKVLYRYKYYCCTLYLIKTSFLLKTSLVTNLT